MVPVSSSIACNRAWVAVQTTQSSETSTIILMPSSSWARTWQWKTSVPRNRLHFIRILTSGAMRSP